MSYDELEPFIEKYIQEARNVLPEGFETEDILEDLRKQIITMLDAKIHDTPDVEPKLLLYEVFEELGPPEKIEEKALEPQITFPTSETKRSPKLTLAIRGVVSGVVVVIAAAIMYYTANWDFLTTLLLLSVFVIIEWVFKAWEMQKHR